MHAQIACETFCLDTDDTFSDASLALQGEALTKDTVRFMPANEASTLDKQLTKYHNKKALACKLKRNPTNLHLNSTGTTERSTILIEIDAIGVRELLHQKTFVRLQSLIFIIYRTGGI